MPVILRHIKKARESGMLSLAFSSCDALFLLIPRRGGGSPRQACGRAAGREETARALPGARPAAFLPRTYRTSGRIYIRMPEKSPPVHSPYAYGIPRCYGWGAVSRIEKHMRWFGAISFWECIKPALFLYALLAAPCNIF